MSIALIAISDDIGGDTENDGLNETKCDSIWFFAGLKMRSLFSMQGADPTDFICRTIFAQERE